MQFEFQCVLVGVFPDRAEIYMYSNAFASGELREQFRSAVRVAVKERTGKKEELPVIFKGPRKQGEADAQR
jgi:hypothetical protein